MAWNPPSNISPKVPSSGLFSFLANGFRYIGGALRYGLFGLKGFILIAVVSIFQHLIPKLLVGLGVGFITYNLGSYSLDAMYSAVTNNFSGLPSDFLAMMKLARLDDFLSVIFGAYTAKLTLQGLAAGVSIRKFGVLDA